MLSFAALSNGFDLIGFVIIDISKNEVVHPFILESQEEAEAVLAHFKQLENSF